MFTADGVRVGRPARSAGDEPPRAGAPIDPPTEVGGNRTPLSRVGVAD